MTDEVTIEVYHLLCVECGDAIIADTIAKRKRIPRSPRCPLCDEKRGDTWRPIQGPANVLAEVTGDYATFAVQLNKSGYTIRGEEQ